MTSPTGPWTDTEALNAAKMYARTTAVTNGILAGLGDTGWLPLTAAAGWTSQGAAARMLNGVVYLRGAVSKSSFTSSSLTNVATLPDGVTPPAVMETFSVPDTTSAVQRYTAVTPAGSVQMANVGGSGTSSFYWLTGITYPVG